MPRDGAIILSDLIGKFDGDLVLRRKQITDFVACRSDDHYDRFDGGQHIACIVWSLSRIRGLFLPSLVRRRGHDGLVHSRKRQSIITATPQALEVGKIIEATL